MVRLHGSIIVTYRCNARCNMCDVWKYPTKASDEIKPETMRKLPDMFFTNVTGGEPFVRQDLPEILYELKKKSRRIVISTNGFFTDRIISLCKENPDVGIRISIEGLREANDAIRGIPDGYAKTQNTLSQLRAMGLKDIGFAMTVQDLNYNDLVPLYEMARDLGYEFATATVHNSHYFHKLDNKITAKAEVQRALKELIEKLLTSKKPKEWLRAYFNYGLMNYIEGKPRFLPCEMGKNGFFLDPSGDILACNGMDAAEPLGNINGEEWDAIWGGRRAKRVRTMTMNCKKNCWMIGSAAPAIIHHPIKPIIWVLKNKMRSLFSTGSEMRI